MEGCLRRLVQEADQLCGMTSDDAATVAVRGRGAM